MRAGYERFDAPIGLSATFLTLLYGMLSKQAENSYYIEQPSHKRFMAQTEDLLVN